MGTYEDVCNKYDVGGYRCRDDKVFIPSKSLVENDGSYVSSKKFGSNNKSSDKAIISIMTPTRRDSISYGLFDFLDSLVAKTYNIENIEMVLNFDDDEDFSDVIEKFNTYPFSIKWDYTPRGRGYIDLNLFYNHAFFMTNPKTKVIAAMCDDYLINIKDWDVKIIEASSVDGDIFILHSKNRIPDLNYSFYDNAVNGRGMDENTMWSRKLMEICGGHFPSTALDGWTNALEWFLWHDHKINIYRAIDVEFSISQRKTFSTDVPGSRRWNVDRRIVHNFLNRENFIRVVREQANNVALRLK